MHKLDYIVDNIQRVRSRIAKACEKSNRKPDDVLLIAVTKYTSTEAIIAAYNSGVVNFGENRIQDAKEKILSLSTIIRPTWHMIGHLQSNKAKLATELFSYIHGVDSVKLAEDLNRHTSDKLKILIQVNISQELTKSGCSITELNNSINSICKLPNLDIQGLMTIAPIVYDSEEARPVLRRLRELCTCYGFKHLSMGMTDDYEIAIEEGSTMVRIGRAIFGE